MFSRYSPGDDDDDDDDDDNDDDDDDDDGYIPQVRGCFLQVFTWL